MTPSSLTYEIGQDQYGRRLTLEHKTGYGGGWRIASHAFNQRDETTTVLVTTLIAEAILKAFQ